MPESTLELEYHAPLDWGGLCRYFAARAIARVESVDGLTYRRTVRWGGHGQPLVCGWLEVRPAEAGAAARAGAGATARAGTGALCLRLSGSLAGAAPQVALRVRRQFDLDCDPARIARALGPLMQDFPGLRVPGAFDGLETVVRGILGQQITVAAASTIAGRVARSLGPPVATPFAELTHAFPDAPALAAASADTLGRLGIVRTRVAAIRGLAQACADGRIRLEPGVDVAEAMRALRAIRGIGEWTAQYAAMRALKWPDAFPAGDYGILKALGTRNPRQARERAEQWRPWRAYAAMCLWRSL